MYINQTEISTGQAFKSRCVIDSKKPSMYLLQLTKHSKLINVEIMINIMWILISMWLNAIKWHD